MNNELGTDYVLSPTEDSTYDEMVTFYTNMSLDEFAKYVRDAYVAEQEFDKAVGQETEMRKDNFPVGYSTVEQQKYYYAANFNYLHIYANTTKVNGKTIYTGDIKSAGCYIDSYPAYKVDAWTSSFSNDKKTVDMSYRCVKCISKDLVYATKYTVNMTFRAGAGDIHAIITV